MIYQVINKEKRKRKVLDVSDRKDLLSVRTYCFITGKSIMENIKEIIAYFGAFKEKACGVEITCNTIQKITSL